MDAAAAEVGNQDHVGTLLNHRHELVVHVHVPDAVGEGVDPRLQETLRIFEREDVGGHPQAVLVRLVDDGAVELRSQLVELAAAVVHPDLDEVHVRASELLDRRPRLLRRVDPVGDFRASGLVPGDSPAGGHRARGARDRGVPDRGRRLAVIVPQAHRSPDAVVGAPLEIVDQGVTRDREVHMRVDERGDHRPAGEVHMRGALRRHDLVRCARGDETTVLHDKGGVFDRIAAVTRDHGRPVEHGGVRLRHLLRRSARAKKQKGG